MTVNPKDYGLLPFEGTDPSDVYVPAETVLTGWRAKIIIERCMPYLGNYWCKYNDEVLSKNGQWKKLIDFESVQFFSNEEDAKRALFAVKPPTELWKKLLTKEEINNKGFTIPSMDKNPEYWRCDEQKPPHKGWYLAWTDGCDTWQPREWQGTRWNYGWNPKFWRPMPPIPQDKDIF